MSRLLNFILDILRCVANIVLQLSHGHSVTPVLKEDPIVSLLETAARNFTEITTPGRWWVDVVPALKYVPEWFPGTAWKQRVKFYKSFLRKTISVPSYLVKYVSVSCASDLVTDSISCLLGKRHCNSLLHIETAPARTESDD